MPDCRKPQRQQRQCTYTGAAEAHDAVKEAARQLHLTGAAEAHDAVKDNKPMPDAARPVQMHPWELARLKQQELIQADAPRPIMLFHRLTTCLSYQQPMSIVKSILFIICIHLQKNNARRQSHRAFKATHWSPSNKSAPIRIRT